MLKVRTWEHAGYPGAVADLQPAAKQMTGPEVRPSKIVMLLIS